MEKYIFVNNLFRILQNVLKRRLRLQILNGSRPKFSPKPNFMEGQGQDQLTVYGWVIAAPDPPTLGAIGEGLHPINRLVTLPWSPIKLGLGKDKILGVKRQNFKAKDVFLDDFDIILRHFLIRYVLLSLCSKKFRRRLGSF